uniref:Uncharacterized protein n=1 Tax=Panagrolaimus sp. ES5 TaxID=591445 RepID=A0AC34FL89_9BILA
MEIEEKGFISALPVKFARFIGIFDNYIYAISDNKKQFRLYKKEIINTGDWKLIWSKPVNLLESKQCRFHFEGNLVYGLASNSILIFYGTGTFSNTVFKLIKLDLQTLKEIEVICDFEGTDFFIEHLSEICNECQNSKISFRNNSNSNPNESSIILTHFKEYLTSMTFEIDFSTGEIGRREIKFSVIEISADEDQNYGFQKVISNMAINSEGVVAVIASKKMLCTEFKSDDNEYIETWYECDELSDSPQLNDYSQIHLYSVGNAFKCLIWYEDETHKCFNIIFSNKSENHRFTLLNAIQIPSFSLPEPIKSCEIIITNEYFLLMDDVAKEMYTFVARMLSLSEASYLTLQRMEKISLNKLKKKIGFPKFLPITRPPENC